VIACACNPVSSSDIQSYLGPDTRLSTVVSGLGLGTCCGTCLEIAQELAQSTLEASPHRINIVSIVAIAAIWSRTGGSYNTVPAHSLYRTKVQVCIRASAKALGERAL